jgi:hypothetical protein
MAMVMRQQTDIQNSFFNMDNAKGTKNYYGPLAQGTI